MIRLVSAALTGALIVSLVGCSERKDADSSPSSSSANPTPGLMVSIDGQDQHVKGPVTCTTSDGVVNIAIGDKISGTDQTAYSATMTDADPPEVRTVLLGVGEDDPTFLKDFYNDTAQATKDGKSYKITGTASSKNKQNRHFEMDVTCP